jgi:citrate lyase beta subunit
MLHHALHTAGNFIKCDSEEAAAAAMTQAVRRSGGIVTRAVCDWGRTGRAETVRIMGLHASLRNLDPVASQLQIKALLRPRVHNDVDVMSAEPMLPWRPVS